MLTIGESLLLMVLIGSTVVALALTGGIITALIKPNSASEHPKNQTPHKPAETENVKENLPEA